MNDGSWMCLVGGILVLYVMVRTTTSRSKPPNQQPVVLQQPIAPRQSIAPRAYKPPDYGVTFWIGIAVGFILFILMTIQLGNWSNLAR